MKTKIWMTGASMATVLSLSAIVSVPQAFAKVLFPFRFPTTTSFSINTSVLWNAQLDVPYSEQLQAGAVTVTVPMRMDGPNRTPLHFLNDKAAAVTVHRTMSQVLNGTGTYKWSLKEGSLPDGLTLSDSGLISGTPTGPDGTTSVTLQVTGTNGQITSRMLPITVFGVHLLQVTTASLPTGVAGQPYQSKLSALGGQGAYMWKVVQGTLPLGVTLASDGTLSGTPQRTGVYAVTVQTFDALGDSAAKYYVLNVANSKH